jgi:LCP family protein required for cell wall assembly
LGLEDEPLPVSSSNPPPGDNEISVGNSPPNSASTESPLSTGPSVIELNPVSLTPQPKCDGPAEMLILAIGTDRRRDDYVYGLSDVMRLIHVDFITPKVSVLTIPRDLWVEIPGISDHHGITHSKLNQAYFYGTEAMGYYDGPGGGAGLLARTLDLNFGLRVENYIVVNMRTFEDMIDAVGGINIYLPYAIDGTLVKDPKDNMGYFPKGWNYLSGVEAVNFARIRKIDSVFQRDNRQTQVLCAAKEKFLRPSIITKVPALIDSFKGRIITDLSLKDLFHLACLVPEISDENLIFASFPIDLMVPGRAYDPEFEGYTYIWDVDFNVLSSYIQEFLAGTWPESPGNENSMSCE